MHRRATGGAWRSWTLKRNAPGPRWTTLTAWGLIKRVFYDIRAMTAEATQLLADVQAGREAEAAAVEQSPGVLAPVDRSHGFQVRISAACLARRSGVHPFAMLRLQ